MPAVIWYSSYWLKFVCCLGLDCFNGPRLAAVALNRIPSGTSRGLWNSLAWVLPCLFSSQLYGWPALPRTLGSMGRQAGLGLPDTQWRLHPLLNFNMKWKCLHLDQIFIIGCNGRHSHIELTNQAVTLSPNHWRHWPLWSVWQPSLKAAVRTMVNASRHHKVGGQWPSISMPIIPD